MHHFLCDRGGAVENVDAVVGEAVIEIIGIVLGIGVIAAAVVLTAAAGIVVVGVVLLVTAADDVIIVFIAGRD